LGEVSKIDGMPILAVTNDSLTGTWCSYCPLSVGLLADEEFTFASDHTFVWRSLLLTDDDEVEFPRTEGSWLLEDNTLKLNIASRQDPHFVVASRIHFSVRMRENDGQRQLVLTSTLCDDESYEAIDGHHRVATFPFEASPGDADVNHREYEAGRKKKISLDSPFKKLVSILSKAVPVAIAKLHIPDPVFCVRLFFHDTHAPPENYCCWVRCLTEPSRQRVLKTVDPINVPDSLWHPTMGIANELPEGVYEADLTSNAEIVDLYSEIYKLLEESSDENVPRLRAALRQVCLLLHMIKWPEQVKTTDDFVVFPADGSNFFAGEYQQDMRVSIPNSRLALLAERGYITKP